MNMGRVDILFRFLQLAQIDRPSELDRYTNLVDTAADSPDLATQIADLIISQRPELAEQYKQAWQELRHANPYRLPMRDEFDVELTAAFGEFMLHWIELEREMTHLLDKHGLGSPGIPTLSRQALGALTQSGVLSHEDGVVFNRLRNMRNELTHGRKPVDKDTLRLASKEAQKLLQRMQDLQAKASHPGGLPQTAS
jgi:hypothetical protein